MEPWEGLDIDDTDLATFVRRCNSTTNVIPGPAGNVQAVLLNRTSEQPENTQEFVKCIAEASDHRSVPIHGNGHKNLLTFMARFFEINYILYFKLHYRV